MKLVLALFLVTVAMALAVDSDDEWNSYKKSYGKKYETEKEDQKRMKIYFENKKKVDEHNSKFAEGKTTYKKGINQFSDLTEEEFSKHKGFGIKKPT